MLIFQQRTKKITEEDVIASLGNKSLTDEQAGRKIGGKIDRATVPIMIASLDTKEKVRKSQSSKEAQSVSIPDEKLSISAARDKASKIILDAVKNGDISSLDGDKLKKEIRAQTAVEGIDNVFKKIGYDVPFNVETNANVSFGAGVANITQNVPIQNIIYYGCKLVDDSNLSAEEKKQLKTEIIAQTTVEGIANVFKKYGHDDLLRAFTDWVKLNYDKRLKDETARIIRPPARLPRVVTPPDIVSRTSKAAEAENEEAGKVAKEYNVLKKTPGQESAESQISADLKADSRNSRKKREDG